MNLLIDQNISFRLIKKLEGIYLNLHHVSQLNLTNSSDIDIWGYARKNNFTIVTFDSDFIDISNLKGHPPKIIWLNIGNTSTQNVANKLIEEQKMITLFIENDESAFLEII